MELSLVEEILKPYLEEHDLKLYDIKWANEFGSRILQVFVDSADGINTDELALVNDYLSGRLDEIDGDLGEYMLEVSSPGAEKPLRNKDEVQESVGKYIHVAYDGLSYDGDLISFDGDTLTIKVNVKGRYKHISVLYNKLNEIRLAVKF